MAREATQFKPGNPGRPKGTPNRKTLRAEAFAQSFLKDADFQDAVRNILANPQHPHWQWTVEIVLQYAYGKPTEHKHVTTDGSMPEGSAYQFAWVDYREFTQHLEVTSDERGLTLPVQAEELPG